MRPFIWSQVSSNQTVGLQNSCMQHCVPFSHFWIHTQIFKIKKSMEKIESLVRKRTGFGKSIDPPGPQHSNRELDFCLLPGSHANVMRLWRFLKAQLNIWAARYSALSPCRFDHNLWQMVNTAEAIRKSLSSLMEERVSALINIRPCSTFSHCKSSLVDLERVSTLRLRYQHRLKARDRLMCYRA